MAAARNNGITALTTARAERHEAVSRLRRGMVVISSALAFWIAAAGIQLSIRRERRCATSVLQTCVMETVGKS